jgi:hypothetical protein
MSVCGLLVLAADPLSGAMVLATIIVMQTIRLCCNWIRALPHIKRKEHGHHHLRDPLLSFIRERSPS